MTSAAGQGSDAIQLGEPNRTQPLGLIVNAIGGLRQLVFPIAAGSFALFNRGSSALIVAGAALLLVLITLGFSYIAWRRRTFTVGEEDIRVESGIISRSAASVPYERIQDVSLEQKLLPRIFGLVEVKFETGAGGAEELKLAYLTAQQGEYLRGVVREQRAEGAAAKVTAEGEETPAPLEEEPGETLFAMGPARLITNGMFQFSLAVFAVLFGLLSQFDNFLPFDIWDSDFWTESFSGQAQQFEGLSLAAQIVSGFTALGTLILLGFATGIAQVFAREWGFVLEKTARGFRRRRGLFTKTDVVMPTHRVQAVKIGTRWLRYRFGWHALKFVSLASDFAGSSHVVAPFAKRREIDPIIRAAGFAPPEADFDWHRASRKSRFDAALIDALIFGVIAIVVAYFAPTGFALIPIALGVLSVLAELYSWTFKRHAVDDGYIFATEGLLSPATQIASKVKLHSVEVSQGPIAQYRGYATLHLGLAGGSFSISGIPLERAFELRTQIAARIAETDFSVINKA